MHYQPVQNAPYTHAIRARDNASTHDLVRDVTDAARYAVRMLRRMPWPDTLQRSEASRLAYRLAREGVHYVRENGDQLIRMPWRTLEDGEGDCKSTAVLIASVAAWAGRHAVLRFVKYADEAHYAHVYAVVDGVAVDPELPFATETEYASKTDRAL